MRVKFGVLEETQGVHLQATSHLNVFIVSATGGEKHQFWANFDIWGTPAPTPFIDEGQIWCAIADPLYAYVPNFVSISLFCRPPAAKNHKFCRGRQHFVVSPVGGNRRQLNMAAQLQHLENFGDLMHSFAARGR